VLDDAVAIARGLRSGTPLLPTATRRLNRALDAATPLLDDLHRTKATAQLGRALDALGALVRNPARSPAVAGLTVTVRSVQTALDTLLPAQLYCNVAGLFVHNVVAATSDGDGSGRWLNALGVFDTAEIGSESNLTQQSAKPSTHLHANPYPNEGAQECESGNEPYAAGTVIGNAPGQQPNSTAETRP
jgi:hypothetical protein